MCCPRSSGYCGPPTTAGSSVRSSCATNSQRLPACRDTHNKMSAAAMMDSALFDCAYLGDFNGVTTGLAHGANVNGSQVLPCPPIAAAAAGRKACMVNFLIERGADPNKPVNRDTPNPKRPGCVISSGERALHIAAIGGDVDTVRVLTRAFADPNVTDKNGHTPLYSACSSPYGCEETVWLLLGAGADVTLGGDSGNTCLHMAARLGRIGLIELLYSGARDALNSYDAERQTPLFLACLGGHESVVSRLIYLGAIQPMPHPGGRNSTLPLSIATIEGLEGVVRVLISEEGMRAVGGATVLPDALLMAILYRHARILHLLLAADGEERQSTWANIIVSGKSLLQISAGQCFPAAVSVLLAAGADETALLAYFEGRARQDVIGVDLSQDELLLRDPEEAVVILRMLKRGAAYRAWSWAWPTDEKEEDAAGGCGGGSNTDGDVTVYSVLSSALTAWKPPPLVYAAIFRPKSDRKLFLSLIYRYCRKEE